jgi:hypothetical protein
MVSKEECCPVFDPSPWQERELTWQDKPFIKDAVRAFLHIPFGMGKVIPRMWQKVEAADAVPDEFIMLFYDPSPWKCEMYMAVKHEVPGAENITLSGTYLTKVYDGPYKDCGKFYADMKSYVQSKGKEAKKIYFYFTTCPKCAKLHGHNYMVGFAQV